MLYLIKQENKSGHHVCQVLANLSVYNPFLAPDSTRVSSKGLVYTHKPSGKERWKWIKPGMEEVHVLRVAEGVAIIYYQTMAELYDRPGSLRSQLWSSTWRKMGMERNGRELSPGDGYCCAQQAKSSGPNKPYNQGLRG
jgi:hypothetical protein